MEGSTEWLTPLGSQIGGACIIQVASKPGGMVLTVW